MPAARHSRNIRRKAATRKILGALDENAAVNSSDAIIPEFAAKDHTIASIDASEDDDVGTRSGSAGRIDIPPELDGTDPAMIRLLIEDIDREVESRKNAIALIAEQAKSEQQEALFVQRMKIPKSIRNMTLREFNAKFECDVLAEVIGAIRKEEAGARPPHSAVAAAAVDVGVGKKRDRSAGGKLATTMELVTPLPKASSTLPGRHAPGTAIRTVKRGEAMYSANLSPIEMGEEGDIFAAVCKRRKGESEEEGSGAEAAAVFDLNVGEGRYVNLDEPGTIEHLDQAMKDEAKSQIKVLQDQMARLMTRLEK